MLPQAVSKPTTNIIQSRKDCICIEPVIDGLSDRDEKLLVVNNIESISDYHNYKKRTGLQILALLKNLQHIEVM
jgi:hypothetical protein